MPLTHKQRCCSARAGALSCCTAVVGALAGGTPILMLGRRQPAIHVHCWQQLKVTQRRRIAGAAHRSRGRSGQSGGSTALRGGPAHSRSHRTWLLTAHKRQADRRASTSKQAVSSHPRPCRSLFLGRVEARRGEARRGVRGAEWASCQLGAVARRDGPVGAW